MFTDNYIKLSNLFFMGDSYKRFVNAAGNEQDGYSYNLGSYGIGKYMKSGQCRSLVTTMKQDPNPDNSVCPGVYFGSGSTPATKADYTLASPITSGLAITSPSAVVWSDDGNGKHTACADFTVRNTSQSEINIYEIGLFSAVQSNYSGYNGNYSNQWWLTLMERTVLEEPITIAPGEAKLVTYKITFNQTLNVE